MSDRIAASLRQLFEENRIVFWYDADHTADVDQYLNELRTTLMAEIAAGKKVIV
ncbi:hypothetical protein LZA78_02945 [Sinirhodobacter sp. WL0062]|uniref:Uncharacterized protein n=1 Tax=Rhodobacter flavimaris TaxID=2907145 RepID=A0ABS8YRD3_9RHOB|nr:hypothetical protein [Sinirhodobacter sp. WL0062]MCE5972447.1 hypothetical protein [Sinirhodobacter sp. WL0062]